MSHDMGGRCAEIPTCNGCAQAALLLRAWRNKQGHDRCWYYPEIFRMLCDIFGVEVCKDPALPPREEFREGCRRYEDEQYGPSLRIRAVPEVKVKLYLEGQDEPFSELTFEQGEYHVD